MARFAYVVDDDEIVRLSLRALIGARGGMAAPGFTSGDAFLDGVDDRESGVVLLDMNMPGTTGIEVLKQLAPMQHRFATVVLTGLGGIGVAVEAMKLGAVDFLEKPYEPATLFAAIDRAFEALDSASATAGRTAEAKALIDLLSPREQSVLDLLIDGAANKAMADTLSLSVRTVEVHRANLMDKLHADSLSAVLRIAYAAGRVTPGSIWNSAETT